MLGRAAGIWETASLPNKLRIQEALFPHGLTVTKEEIGTSSMPLFFRHLHEVPNRGNKFGVHNHRELEPPLGVAQTGRNFLELLRGAR
jgi:hypothetical protein